MRRPAVHGLEVGFVFDLRRELPPMVGELLWPRYRLVAMAVNPEGHHALVAYEEDSMNCPPNGRPVPVVALMQRTWYQDDHRSYY